MVDVAVIPRVRAIPAWAWVAGIVVGSALLRYGLTRRRIAQIIAEHRLSQRVTRRDAFRAMNYRAGGKPIDQALAAMPPGDARHYAKLRRIMGAAYARAALGLVACGAPAPTALRQRAMLPRQ